MVWGLVRIRAGSDRPAVLVSSNEYILETKMKYHVACVFVFSTVIQLPNKVYLAIQEALPEPFSRLEAALDYRQVEHAAPCSLTAGVAFGWKIHKTQP